MSPGMTTAATDPRIANARVAGTYQKIEEQTGNSAKLLFRVYIFPKAISVPAASRPPLVNAAEIYDC
jgi:hypothetical protein